jgi:hypothetical protein
MTTSRIKTVHAVADTRDEAGLEKLPRTHPQ